MSETREQQARELARTLGTIIETRGVDWAHLEDLQADLLKPISRALAACALENYNAAVKRCAQVVCYGREAGFPFDKHDRHQNENSYFPCRAREIRALERAAGEGKS